MATICKKCGGIIPDLGLDFLDRNDCKNHYKPKDILHPKHEDFVWVGNTKDAEGIIANRT